MARRIVCFPVPARAARAAAVVMSEPFLPKMLQAAPGLNDTTFSLSKTEYSVGPVMVGPNLRVGIHLVACLRISVVFSLEKEVKELDKHRRKLLGSLLPRQLHDERYPDRRKEAKEKKSARLGSSRTLLVLLMRLRPPLGVRSPAQ